MRQFDIAFEGVHSLHKIEMAKEMAPINKKQIANNMRDLRSKLQVCNIHGINYTCFII